MGKSKNLSSINYFLLAGMMAIFCFVDVYGQKGKTFQSIKIGQQEWMLENLDVSHFRNGDPIPEARTSREWQKAGEQGRPAWCYYDNDPKNGRKYGKLYNWYAVDPGSNGGKNICPSGWHVPTDEEWTALENYLRENGYNYDGTTEGNKYAKSLAATTNWLFSSNTGAVGNTDFPEKRNITGFTALPGGYRKSNGTFSYIGSYGQWWSATEFAADYAWQRYLGFYASHVYRRFGNDRKKSGLSVRCLRDN